MCGIAGYTGPTRPGTLQAMADAMIHRGPDGEGFFTSGWVNLCMRRLAIVDIQGGRQPMRDEASGVTMVFNGEIYNHVELRAELESAGVVFDSDHSDTEVVLRLYLRHGQDFVTRLNGMFAMAIADDRTREVWLYRDRFGERPLYYSLEPGGHLAFASEFNVLKKKDMAAHIDGGSLRWFFAMKAMPDDRTIDSRISRMPAGCRLRWREGSSPEPEAYYRLPTAVDQTWSFNAAADAFHVLLRDAVSLRLRADVEVGAYLSGGVDSSLITALAAGMAGRPLNTYCLIYNEDIYRKSDDRRFAREVSTLYGTRHQEILLTPEILLEALPGIAGQYGQPNAVAVASWFVSQAMGRDIKVALSGDAADELFGSYFVHRVAAALEQGPDVAGASPEERRFLESLAAGSVAELYSRFAVFTPDEIEGILSPKAPPGPGVEERLAARERSLGASGVFNRVLEYEIRHPLTELILNYVDVLSMAHSLEPRPPFLDHRLVELVFSLPAQHKNQGGNTKRLLKRVAEGYLPRELVHRPKEGFIEPNIHWLTGPLRTFAIETLESPTFNRLGLLRPEPVRGLVQNFFRTGDYYLGKKVWMLLLYALWEQGV